MAYRTIGGSDGVLMLMLVSDVYEVGSEGLMSD